MSSPLAAMQTQHRKSAPEDGTNPAASVFLGGKRQHTGAHLYCMYMLIADLDREIRFPLA